MEMSYEVGLNIGIEMMREEATPKRPYICWSIAVLLMIDLYFLWAEPRSDC